MRVLKSSVAIIKGMLTTAKHMLRPLETVDYPNPYLHDLWGRAARARVGEGREGVR